MFLSANYGLFNILLVNITRYRATILKNIISLVIFAVSNIKILTSNGSEEVSEF